MRKSLIALLTISALALAPAAIAQEKGGGSGGPDKGGDKGGDKAGHGQRHFYQGHWVEYGVGPCWKSTGPGVWVWICPE